MAAPKARPEDLHFIPTTMQRYRIMSLDRAVRREALSTIFNTLKTETPAQKLRALHQIIREISRYHFERSYVLNQRRGEGLKWFSDVADHAEALAELIREYPDDFGSWIIIPNRPELTLEHLQIAHDNLIEWAQRARRFRDLSLIHI